MKKNYFFILLLIFYSAFSIKAENNIEVKYTISGSIIDKANGERLIGASIRVKELNTGTVTNLYGYYSLTLPIGNYTLVYSYIGYNKIEKTINLQSNESIEIELERNDKNMKELVIVDKKSDENVTKSEMSSVELDMEIIKSLPALMGETDLIKVIQLMPGVQTAGEASSGFNVRGGSADQNLVLLDEATVYNASHLMGFFSVFNSDAIKDVKLYKGDIPAAYGGRLSSLLDIRMKDGNNRKIQGSGGIGTISSRLTIEGPIVKEKGSFIISARRTYADLFLKLSNDTNISQNKLYFYDLNMKLNYQLNKRNRIYFSSYLGQDNFSFGEMFKFSWGNNTETFRWNHIFNDKLFSNFTAIYSNYNYLLGSNQSQFKFDWNSYLRDIGAKADFNYYLNTKNTIIFGISSIYHKFYPGKFDMGTTNHLELKLPVSNALENVIYLGNEQNFGGPLTLKYGVRYSVFQNIGAGTIYHFDDNFNFTDSTNYKSGNIFNTYSGFEPRINANYILSETSSLKASYSRTRQYVQLASNSTTGSPIDIWFPASPNVKPQISDQVALGYFRNFLKNKFETSAEIYYKKMLNQIDFKDFAQLLLNPKLEGELRFGEASSYGLELLCRKNGGKINGWISYTLSKSNRKFKDINNGNSYPANYDKTHNVSVVVNYKISKRVEVSMCWVYITGAPITLPTGRFEYGGTIMPVYSDRNAARMPDYHRLDLSLTLKNKNEGAKKFYGEWIFSVYNAYNRKNAYAIYFEADKNDPSVMKSYKISMFPIIPAISYSFHF
ncbi:MAG: TonB-dependent receptor [Bacteroidetes bacterium]|nr:TonB-dependent receptor [Bacteroidota bacterium]